MENAKTHSQKEETGNHINEHNGLCHDNAMIYKLFFAMHTLTLRDQKQKRQEWWKSNYQVNPKYP